MKLEINNEGVRKFLKSRKYNNDKDKVCEIYGSFPGYVQNMSLDIINNNLIITGDDNGLSNEDINKLCQLFDSKKKGHSEFGIGVRVAGKELISKTDKEFFYVTDGEKGIKYFYDKETGEIEDCYYLFGNEERYPPERTDNEAEQIYKDYPSTIDNKSVKKKTRWIIPISEDFLNRNNMEEIKNDIKIRFCKPILLNEINIYFEAKKLEIKTKFFEIHNTDHIKIVSGKLKKNDKPSGNSNDYYIINNDYYDKKTVKQINSNNLVVENVKYEFEVSYYNPGIIDLDEISKEYNINKTLYNGILILKNDVILSTEFILAKGQRNAGTDKKKHIIISIQNLDENNNCYKVHTEKNDKPKLENAPKEFISFYKNIKSKNISNKAVLNDDTKEEFQATLKKSEDNLPLCGTKVWQVEDYIDNDEAVDDELPLCGGSWQENHFNNNEVLNIENKNRSSKDSFTPIDRDFLYQELTEYQFRKKQSNYNGRVRCPICDRYLSIINLHAGHIQSVKNGGETELKNGLAICRKCNGNDPRQMLDMVKEEWGEKHPNYIRTFETMTDLGKGMSNYK
jgi:hypothetical protein